MSVDASAVSPDLLGRHVAHRPHDAAGFSRDERGRCGQGRHRRLRSRQAEVEDFGLAVARDEDVLRLEVAVDDPLRVGGGKPIGNVRRQLNRLSPGQQPPPDSRPQALALQQLDHGDGLVVHDRELMDGHDVRMGDRRNGTGLVLEPGPHLRISCEMVRQYPSVRHHGRASNLERGRLRPYHPRRWARRLRTGRGGYRGTDSRISSSMVRRFHSIVRLRTPAPGPARHDHPDWRIAVPGAIVRSLFHSNERFVPENDACRPGSPRSGAPRHARLVLRPHFSQQGHADRFAAEWARPPARGRQP